MVKDSSYNLLNSALTVRVMNLNRNKSVEEAKKETLKDSIDILDISAIVEKVTLTDKERDSLLYKLDSVISILKALDSKSMEIKICIKSLESMKIDVLNTIIDNVAKESEIMRDDKDKR